jgi:Flp pilus assembly protein TadB
MTQKPPILEMTIEGEFVDPPQPRRLPFGTRVLIWAAVVAAIAVAGVVALAALWLLAFMIPVALIAVIVAYGVFRYQMWRGRGSDSGGTVYWVRRR